MINLSSRVDDSSIVKKQLNDLVVAPINSMVQGCVVLLSRYKRGQAGREQRYSKSKVRIRAVVMTAICRRA
jgi:hypothetical protein